METRQENFCLFHEINASMKIVVAHVWGELRASGADTGLSFAPLHQTPPWNLKGHPRTPRVLEINFS